MKDTNRFNDFIVKDFWKILTEAGVSIEISAFILIGLSWNNYMIEFSWRYNVMIEYR